MDEKGFVHLRKKRSNSVERSCIKIETKCVVKKHFTDEDADKDQVIQDLVTEKKVIKR